MWTVGYWKRLAEDALTAVIAGVAVVVQASGFDVFTADWKALAQGAVTAAVVAVVKGLAAKPVGDPLDTSFVKPEIVRVKREA